ncbi:MAG: hypothetical protein JXM79_18545 [Sedimentisphaerales bacterium]|nr:hypothetical protein [Sedimentisphaerales bacterium]
MADGHCDIPGCEGHTYMGWRPKTEQRGYQICKSHALRHRDPGEDFDLFDVFGLKRPTGTQKSAAKKDVAYCAGGRERLPGHKLCTVCADNRERQRKKLSYHKRKNRPQPESVKKQPALRCADCGAKRERSHTYCPKCGKVRRKQSNRVRQKRHYRKTQKPNAFVPELTGAVP